MPAGGGPQARPGNRPPGTGDGPSKPTSANPGLMKFHPTSMKSDPTSMKSDPEGGAANPLRAETLIDFGFGQAEVASAPPDVASK